MINEDIKEILNMLTGLCDSQIAATREIKDRLACLESKVAELN